MLLVGVFAAGIAVSWLVAPRVITPKEVEATREPPIPGPITALAEVGVLREVLMLQAEVRPRVEISIQPWAPIGATRPVVTYLPEPGSEIRSGDVIVGLSGRPLIFVSGMANLYRDLHVGLSGSDVAALQKALLSLGYLESAADVNGDFGEATEEAVSAWYGNLGYAPALMEAATSVGVIVVPVDELLGLPYETLVVEQSPYDEGDLVDSRPLVELRTTDAQVVASATFAQRTRLAVGQPATVLAGTIERPSTIEGITVADPGTASDFVVTFEDQARDIPIGTSVTVEIELRTTATAVVSVPLSAIRTDADGTSFVTVVDGESLTEVRVQTGATIGGRTEVVSGLSGDESVVVG